MLQPQRFDMESRNIAQAMNADRLDIAANVLGNEFRTNPREALGLIQREMQRERIQPSAAHMNVMQDGAVVLQDGTRSVLAGRIPPAMAQQLAMQNTDAGAVAYNPNAVYTNPNIAYGARYPHHPNYAQDARIANQIALSDARYANGAYANQAYFANPNGAYYTNPNVVTDGSYIPPNVVNSNYINAPVYDAAYRPAPATYYGGDQYYGRPDPGRMIAATIGNLIGGIFGNHHRPYCPPGYYGGYQGYQGYQQPMPIIPFMFGGRPHHHRW